MSMDNVQIISCPKCDLTISSICSKCNKEVEVSKLDDGCVVFIGRKEEEEPFDSTEFAKEFASILSDFAQVISILLIASR